MQLPQEVINIILSFLLSRKNVIFLFKKMTYLSQKHPYNLLSSDNHTYLCPDYDIFLSDLIKSCLKDFIEDIWKKEPIQVIIEISIHFSSTSELHIFYSYIDFNRLNCEHTGYCCDKKGMKVKVK